MIVKRLLEHSFSVMAIAALIISFSFPNTPLFAESSLEELEKEYAEKYKLYLILEEAWQNAEEDSDESNNLEKIIKKLEGELEDLSKKIENMGGDTDKIQDRVDIEFEQESVEGKDRANVIRAALERQIKDEIRLPAGGITKFKAEEKEQEYLNPEDDFPWKLDQWPAGAKSIVRKDFMASMVVLDKQTKWSKDMRKNIRGGWTDRKDYYFDVIVVMYEHEYGKNSVDQSKADSISFYVGNWIDPKSTETIINEVFDTYMAEVKSKSVKWDWLGKYLRFDKVRPEYESAQRGLRRQLTTSYAEWDMQKYRAWDGKVEKHVKAILASEKKLLWLLGYAEREKVREIMDAQEKIKKLKFQLANKQEILFNTYLISKYWNELQARMTTQPGGSDPAGADAKAKAAKATDLMAAKYNKLFDKIRVDVQNRTTAYKLLADKIIPAVMKLGVEKAIESKLLVPHKYDKADDFYADVVDKKYYKRIIAIKQTSVYKEFLKNKTESDELSYQNKKRRTFLHGGG